MAANVALGDLRDAVRKRGDYEGYSQLDRHPDADLNGYIARGVKAWWQLINTKPGRFISTFPITTVAGQSLYALPSGEASVQAGFPEFWRLANLYITVNGRQQWLNPFEEYERAFLSDPNVGFLGYPTHYSLQNGNLELLPVPSTGISLVLRYIPAAPALTSETDSIDFINGEEDYVIDYATRLAAAKDALWPMVNHLESSMKMHEARILDEAPRRDMSSPSYVTDTTCARGARSRRCFR